MTDVLHVWANPGRSKPNGPAVPVGVLERVHDNAYVFQYAPEWLAAPYRFALSWSLPLSLPHHVGAPVHSFFQNLLPEGQARRAVAARLGVSIDNDWALLAAIGGECAGALTILPPDHTPTDPDQWQYRPIASETLRQLAAREGIVPLLVGGTSTRLSLAGAQDKVPVAVIDDRLHLPMGSAPSTHILKLPSLDFTDLGVNEAFVTALARAAGLNAVENTLLMQTNPPCLLIRRYDRYSDAPAGPVARVHQEDMCQALGLPAGRKYEQEGGPSLSRTAAVIRKASVNPLQDVQALLRWTAFNVVSGNADAHGKNLALLHTAEGVRLAPLYDLVCTRIYLRLDRRLAMSIGGHRDMDSLLAQHWTREAKKLEMGAPVVLKMVRTATRAILEALEPTRAAFETEFGRQRAVRLIAEDIERRGALLLEGLK